MTPDEFDSARDGFKFGLQVAAYLYGEAIKGKDVYDCLQQIASGDLVLSPTDAEEASNLPESVAIVLSAGRRRERVLHKEIASKMVKQLRDWRKEDA